MITLVIGLPGTGKTLHATKEIRKALAQGLKVYSNVHVNDIDYIFYEDFTLLTQATNGLIVMDEAQVFLNARRWADLPPKFEFFLQRHRHNGLDLLAMTQSVSRVDKAMRLLCHEIYEVRPSIRGFGYGLYKLVQVVQKEEETIEIGSSKWKYFTPKDLAYYDTHAYADTPKQPILGKCQVCGLEHLLLGWQD